MDTGTQGDRLFTFQYEVYSNLLTVVRKSEYALDSVQPFQGNAPPFNLLTKCTVASLVLVKNHGLSSTGVGLDFICEDNFGCSFPPPNVFK